MHMQSQTQILKNGISNITFHALFTIVSPIHILIILINLVSWSLTFQQLLIYFYLSMVQFPTTHGNRFLRKVKSNMVITFTILPNILIFQKQRVSREALHSRGKTRRGEKGRKRSSVTQTLYIPAIEHIRDQLAFSHCLNPITSTTLIAWYWHSLSPTLLSQMTMDNQSEVLANIMRITFLKPLSS